MDKTEKWIIATSSIMTLIGLCLVAFGVWGIIMLFNYWGVI